MERDASRETLWSQYQAIKKEYPNTLLLFRVGDFCEAFGDDADDLSREICTELKYRRIGGESVPVFRCPGDFMEQRLRRLLNKGYRVAMIDPLKDPVYGSKKQIVTQGETK